MLPSGKTLWSGFLLDATYEFLLEHRTAVRDFCLVQERSDSILLEIVPGPRCCSPWLLRTARRDVRGPRRIDGDASLRHAAVSALTGMIVRGSRQAVTMHANLPGDELEDLPAHVLDLLRHDHARLEPRLDEMLAVLGRQGAREIWHKHGTFYDHLLGVWRILAAWGQPAEVCRLGLMHSVYSNSVVRMKVFDAAHGERADLRRLIGEEAERLVYLFCTIRREELLFGDLDVPADGVRVRLHGCDDSVQITRHDLGIFLIVTMADYAEQFFGWQDRLFGMPDADGTTRGGAHSLWPGDLRPGLWMAMNSRLGRRAAHCGVATLPPVFDGCTVEVSRESEVAARDLYWRASCDAELQDDGERTERTLQDAIAANPHVAEPHVLLAQALLNRRAWDDAEREASAALDVLARWATPWDKRLSWDAWVAWSRVLRKGAREREWPTDGFRMMSLGEVRPGR